MSLTAVRSLSENKREAIANVSPPEGLAQVMNVVPLPRSEVVALVCNSGDRARLTDSLPAGYEDGAVHEISS